ncbi:MAG: threonine ammonia-lyase, partial [Gammaproteobacteria bacterium]|nr:threonine ammonia-lyase [Gammaproteobacteria bacterium]
HAIMLMLEIEKLVIEGAAATTLASLLNHKLPHLKNKKVLCLISGGNIDVNILTRYIHRGLTFDGRIMHFKSAIFDTPGALEKILGIIRALKGNVLEVQHHRFSSNAPIGQIDISMTLETRDPEHIEEIRQALEQEGYSLQ